MFKLSFETDNASFDPWRPGEIARILKDIAYKIEGGETSGSIMDSNGNKLGNWSI